MFYIGTLSAAQYFVRHLVAKKSRLHVPQWRTSPKLYFLANSRQAVLSFFFFSSPKFKYVIQTKSLYSFKILSGLDVHCPIKPLSLFCNDIYLGYKSPTEMERGLIVKPFCKDPQLPRRAIS